MPDIATETPDVLRVLAWPARRKRVDNPYTYLLQESTAHHGIETTEFGPVPLLRSRWDVIHIHWPDMVLLRGGAIRQAVTGAILLTILRLHRRLGARLVWTVHNLAPHERRSPRVATWFMHAFADLTDGIISPSQSGLKLAKRAYPQLETRPVEVIPIGRYDVEYPDPPSRAEARATLGLSDNSTVFLAFGMIRRYKNLPHLAECFGRIADPDARLVIAGPPKDAAEVERLRTMATNDPRIRIDAERIDDAMVPCYFAAADLFVAPFTAILNSGSLLLALANGCRAIVPASGGLPEVAASVGPGWVTTFDEVLTPEHLLDAAAIEEPTNPPDLSTYEWHAIGHDTADFFRRLSESKALHSIATAARP